MVNTDKLSSSSPDSVLNASSAELTSSTSLTTSSAASTGACFVCLDNRADSSLPINRDLLCSMFPSRQEDILTDRGACLKCYRKLAEMETLRSFQHFCSMMFEEARCELEQMFDLSRHTRLLAQLENQERLRKNFIEAPETNLIGSLQLDSDNISDESHGVGFKGSGMSSAASSWSSESLTCRQYQPTSTNFCDDTNSMLSGAAGEYFDITPLLHRISRREKKQSTRTEGHATERTVMDKRKSSINSSLGAESSKDAMSATENATRIVSSECNSTIDNQSNEGGNVSSSSPASSSTTAASRVNLELHLGEALLKEALRSAALEAGLLNDSVDYNNVCIKLKVDSESNPLSFNLPLSDKTSQPATTVLNDNVDQSQRRRNHKQPIVVKLKRDIYKPTDGVSTHKPSYPPIKSSHTSQKESVDLESIKQTDGIHLSNESSFYQLKLDKNAISDEGRPRRSQSLRGQTLRMPRLKHQRTPTSTSSKSSDSSETKH